VSSDVCFPWIKNPARPLRERKKRGAQAGNIGERPRGAASRPHEREWHRARQRIPSEARKEEVKEGKSGGDGVTLGSEGIEMITAVRRKNSLGSRRQKKLKKGVNPWEARWGK